MSKLDNQPALTIEDGSPAVDFAPLTIQFQITEAEQKQLIESVVAGETVLGDREETLSALLDNASGG